MPAFAGRTLIFSNPELPDAGGLQSPNAFFRAESAKHGGCAGGQRLH
jgi:hypothetical protein